MYKFCSKCGNKLTLNTKTFDSECDRCGFVVANPDAEELRAQYLAEHPEAVQELQNEKPQEEITTETVQEEVVEESIQEVPTEPIYEDVVIVSQQTPVAPEVELKTNPEDLKEDLLDYIHDPLRNIEDVDAFYFYFENTSKNYVRFSDADLLNIMFDIYDYLPSNLVDKYRGGYTNFKVKLDSLEKIDSSNNLIDCITKAKDNFLNYYDSIDFNEYDKKYHQKIVELKGYALKDIDFLSDLEHFNDEYNLIKKQFIDNISQYKIGNVVQNTPAKKVKEPKTRKKSLKGIVFAIIALILVVGAVVAIGFIPTVQYEAVSTKYSYEFLNPDTYSYETKTVKVKGAKVTGIKGLFWDSYFPIKNLEIKSNSKEGEVTVIGEGAFADMGFESVKLPDTIKMIEKNAFKGNNFSEIELPTNLEYIGKNAFEKNSSLTNVVYKGTKELVISDKAFYTCKALKTFNGLKELPKTVVFIGSNSFYKTGIKEIFVYGNIKNIQLDSFGENTTVTVDVGQTEFKNICTGFNSYYPNTIYQVLFSKVKVIFGNDKYGNSVTDTYITYISTKEGSTLDPEILENYQSIENYDFLGLYYLGERVFDGDGNFLGGYIIDGSALIAKYEPIKYKITYELGGGTLQSSKTSYTVEDLGKLPTPTKADNVFMGWLCDGEYVEYYNELNGDVTLTAIWFEGCTVEFYYQDPDNSNAYVLFETLYVEKDDTIGNLPTCPLPYFKEYIIAYNNDLVLTSDTVVKQNLKIYATFYTVYVVTFMNGNEVYTTREVKEGNTLGTLPTISDSNFIEWRIGSTSGSRLYSYTTINRDIEVYAVYDGYNVTYMDRSSVYATQVINSGATLNVPSIPTRSGYTFAGWFTDSLYYNVFDFSNEINGDITLYAKWITAPSNIKATHQKGSGTYNIYCYASSSYSGMSKIAYTALTDGTITVYSIGSDDTYGYLYNSNGTELVSNDDSGADRNFSFTYSVEAGKVYYICVRYYDSSDTGNITVYVNSPDVRIQGE